jgi:signal peptidase II
MRYFLLLTIPFYLLDQFTKYLILQRFPHGPSSDHIEVIPGFFNIVRVHNTGMAFGLGNNGQYSNLIFGVIALVAIIGVVVLWRKNAFPTRTAKTAVALLVSGIFGNLTDRLLPGRGYVVDFLDFHIGLRHWPSFNVADSCICVAAALLFISAFQGEKKAEAE